MNHEAPIPMYEQAVAAWEEQYPERWFKNSDGTHVLRDLYCRPGGMRFLGRVFLPPAEWERAKAEDDALKTEMLEAAGVKAQAQGWEARRMANGAWKAETLCAAGIHDVRGDGCIHCSTRGSPIVDPPKDALMQWPEMKGYVAESRDVGPFRRTAEGEGDVGVTAREQWHLPADADEPRAVVAVGPAHEGGPVCGWLETLAKEAGLPNAKVRVEPLSDGYDVRAYNEEHDCYSSTFIGCKELDPGAADLRELVLGRLKTAAEDLRAYAATVWRVSMVDSIIAEQLEAGGHDTPGTRAEAERWLAMVCSCVCDGLLATTDESVYRMKSRVVEHDGIKIETGDMPSRRIVQPRPLGRP